MSPPPSGHISHINNSNINNDINLSSVLNDNSKVEVTLTSAQSEAVITTEKPPMTKDQFQEDKQTPEGNWDDQMWEDVDARDTPSTPKKKCRRSKVKYRNSRRKQRTNRDDTDGITHQWIFMIIANIITTEQHLGATEHTMSTKVPMCPTIAISGRSIKDQCCTSKRLSGPTRRRKSSGFDQVFGQRIRKRYLHHVRGQTVQYRDV